MNIISRFERRKKEHQTAIVLIHGFAPQTTDTMKKLKADLEALDYVVIAPVLFDITDPLDTDSRKWMARAKIAAQEAVSEYGRVIVAGHSMGALMASYVAATVEGVERVALLSGPFNMLTLATAKQGVLTLIDANDDQKAQPEFYLTEEHHRTMLKLYEDLHFSPSKIEIPVMLIHGDRDDVVDVNASKSAYKMIKHNQKELIIIHDTNHDINENNPGRNIIVNLLHGFIDNHYYQEDVIEEK